MEMVSREIKGFLGNSSWIRRMFEAGIELKAKYGAENVYDFSIGNPDLPAPEGVKLALAKLAEHSSEPFAHGYMPNGGFISTRTAMAKQLSREQGCEITANEVMATCGAAGGLNVFFRTVLEKGDEVMVPAPYFVEYGFYTSNFGGKLVPVAAKELTFELDLEAMEQAFTPLTRAVIINSPNNPTGQIYSKDDMEKLGRIIEKKSAEFGRVIYLIADEPYRFLNYDQVEIPSVFAVCKNSTVIGSYSKNLSLAGERIGFIAVNPAMENKAELMAGLIMANRILGFVNAPATAQKIVENCLNESVDMSIYLRRRNAMAKALTEAGIEFTMPKGAFYFFAKSPTADESIFMDALVRNHVLAVPGIGFGKKGYVRLAFCVSEKVIEKAAPAIKQAAKEAGKQN